MQNPPKPCPQVSAGICAQSGARLVLEDVDVVGRHGAGSSLTIACMAAHGARLELNRWARHVYPQPLCPFLFMGPWGS